MNLDLLIPTYNRARLLERCLESIARANCQDHLHTTIIVIDNNSGDETRNVVQGFAERHSNCSIQYMFVGRRGKSAALNDALARTSAELVGLIDDDEQIAANWFEVVHREFSNAPELEYIGGPYYPDWEGNRPGWLPESYMGAIGIVSRPQRVAFSCEFPGMLMGGNAVLRRSTLQKVLPYPEHLGKLGNIIRSGEDEVIYHRLLEIGAKGMVVPDLIIHHWIPAERVTRTYFRKWAVGRGISVGSQLRENGFAEPSWLGIPRYKFGAAVRGLNTAIAGKSSAKRFSAQLDVLDCFATLYGRHFY